MATYTFTPKSTTQLVFWHDPSIWIGGIVPNGPDANVVLPTATLATGGIYKSSIVISDAEAFTASSLDIANQWLQLDGQLSVLGSVGIRPGAIVDLESGILSVGSLINEGGIQRSGQVLVAGLLVNNSSISGMGLTVTASGLTNSGTLGAGPGNLVVNVPTGGFTNLDGTTLTGGTYFAGDGVLFLNVGGAIANAAATIKLDKGGVIESFDPTSGMYLPLQETLHSIAPSGVLSLAGQSYDWGALSIDGVLELSANATLGADQLTIGTTGQIKGWGTISAPVFNSGLIFATIGLDLQGPVTGPGSLVIDAGRLLSPFINGSHPTLELSTPISQNVIFSNNVGTLIIDHPASFTGTIAPSSLINQHSTGDVIILKGLSLAGLQGHSYEGNSTAGVLSLHYASGTTNLNIAGDFNAGSFNFSAGPQFLTTSPPSLQITVGGTVKLLHDTGPSSTDYVTFDPTITQKAYAGAAVQLVIDGTPLPYIWADGAGVWTYTPVGLADGTHTIVAREFTGGIRASTVPLGTASITFTLDTRLVAHDDAYVALSGQSLSVAVDTGVLINDVVPTSASVSLATGPTHGTLQLGSNGSFSYRPVEGFTGIDVFSYRVTTENGDSAEAQATIYALPVNVSQTTTLDLVSLTDEQQIAATYIAFFGRGADAAGFRFWADEYGAGAGHQAPGTLFANIASSFGISTEAKGLYPFLANPEGASDAQIAAFLEGVYGNLFNRLSDPGGLAYWTDQIKQTLAKGEFVGSVLLDIMSGAQNSSAGQDITTLMSKVAVGLEYVRQQELHGTVWDGPSDLAAASALIESVTADPLSVLIGIQTAEFSLD